MTDLSAQPRYAVIGDFLAEDTGECNCSAIEVVDGYGPIHEPYCGYEPIATMADVLKTIGLRQ